MITKPKLKPPSDAPCWTCVQAIGTSVCKTTCGYWPKLQEMAKAGVLEEA